ncbi:unnamed protein product [Chironomus riparius]|uniref:Uncharacterized protein n=1 Tax=Chironomus riparius TaxID=315576 RepID=A0A9N9S879_9DIPT|nr:unnamed protein product [Chironomus riparius]
MSKLIKYFVQFFVFSVLFGQLASALQCYSCDSTKEKDCHKIGKKTEIKLLDCAPNIIKENMPDYLDGIVGIDFFQNTADEGDVPMVCQKVVLTKGDELITYRGCQLDIEKSDACAVAQSQLEQSGNSEIKITSCDLCSNEDKCNFSSQIISDIRLVFVLLAFIKLIY